MIALTIAGSDSGGGAGIQADIKTFSALGVYGASVITAITAQNTLGVSAIHSIPVDMVEAQFDAVIGDLDVKAIKIGMLADPAVIALLAKKLDGIGIPVVLDPVMVAASGHRLVPEETVSALCDALIPLATLITPNIPEAAVLLGEAEADGLDMMRAQAHRLAALGPAVLLKGGHMSGEAADVFETEDGVETLTSPRVATRNTHGTGCTLSSAIAASLAKGMTLPEAVRAGKTYISGAIAAADRLSIGKGHGPVHHFHALWNDD
ncbi:bifunctional hydroxymethylpyrimidine kinase/phosphomethylpyrimidine kinase [Acuticoccus sp. M5D2P5]|uniref:bifunctional hydroxymethylpyrimidine kinase/phosphomethylpyrimidine kinase n=1 Tax=Acuticoccus kalidii TaxID=2910977 RepID=UPI001F406D65|nr:bifunctional hydroxymethylpyrimidine kinase/phosphomethylpyrimidine kinase [Acuticoccus kalidii]MCF3933119.1 bifunctional hydroxymethylpyrimidine kinase/phosphomethylpyrimidine kinase [Acuticoccus kalidii]